MRHLNNKGYMLVEIILAFALAMFIMYFIMELTIKVKNRNDDLLVRTLTSTDQAIIYNIIMGDVFAGNEFDCNQVSISGKKFSYKGKSVIVNDYVDTLSKSECSNRRKITIAVNALPNDDFNVVIP